MEYRYNKLPELGKDNKRKHLVVLTGAGISVESGLTTFRKSDDSLWGKYDFQKLASVGCFQEDPEAVLEFYNMRRNRLLEVEPNHAHRLLVELEKWYDVTVITQNVDNLHERAGSSNILHLHGELTKVTSSIHRNDPDCIKELPLDVPIQMGDKAADGSQLRPYVVWFGEFVNNYEMAARIVRSADIFVVIGTSLTVTPAADLIKCPHYDVPKFIIDPCEPFDPYDDNYPEGYVHIREAATSGMETFIDRVIEKFGLYA